MRPETVATTTRWRALLPVAAWAAVVAAAAVAWLLVAGGLGIAGAVDAGDAEGDDAAEGNAPDVESGRGDTLYTVHCARCHGADGRGGADATGIAPPLVGMEVARVDLVLRTGRMPPARVDGSGRGHQWSDSERETLVAYLTERFDLEGDVPQPEPEDGEAAAGREVYATHCASCHGYTAGGGVAGAGAITPGVLGREPIVVAEAIRVGPFQMPRFAEEQISDEDIDDLIAYLDEIAHEDTTPIGLRELHPVYLSGFVALLALAIIFSCMFIAGRVALFPDRPTEADADAETDDDRASGATP